MADNNSIEKGRPHSQNNVGGTISHEQSNSNSEHQEYLAYPPTDRRGFAVAEGGSFHPGLWRPYEHRKFANPAPMGLCAFASTTFLAACVNMEVRGVVVPDIVIPMAFVYGGLVQFVTGMWEMAVGNTFGATTFTSYGAFWISYGLLFTPSPWGILLKDGPYHGDTSSAVGLFLTTWFIFTTLMLLCTLRSTWALFLLFFTLDMVYLFASLESYAADVGNMGTSVALKKTAGFFGFCATFFAFWNALAGILDSSNSFFTVPVFHFPWSDKGLENRGKKPVSATA